MEKNPAPHTPTQVGSILVVIIVVGVAAGFVVLAVRLDPDWKRNLVVSVVALLLVVGPFFAVIRWTTWRNLRKNAKRR
jgi:presenilin-like A22 family membrane protease